MPRFTARLPSLHRPTALALLAAIFQLTPLAAQEVPKPVFPQQAMTRVEKACHNLVQRTLVAPATTGDVRSACKCVDDALKVSGFDPSEFLLDQGYGEVVSLPVIASRSRSENPEHSKESNMTAKELYWKATHCLSNLALDAQYSPEREAGFLRAPITQGAARERSNGVGALLATETVTFSTAILNIMEQRFDLHRHIPSYDERTSRQQAMREAEWKFNRELFSVLGDAAAGPLFGKTDPLMLLACRYRIEEKDFSSDSYYFWNPRGGIDKAIIAKLSTDHPVREIRSDPNGCPLRRPKP